MQSHPGRRLHRCLMRAASLLAGVLFALPLAAQQENSSLAPLAEKIAEIVHHAPASSKGERIVVVDFSEFGGGVTQLGVQLAGELSQELSVPGHFLVVVPRVELKKLREEEMVDVAELRNEALALYYSRKVEARFAVLGFLVASADSLELRFRVMDAYREKIVGEASGVLPLDVNRKALLGKQVPELGLTDVQLPTPGKGGYTVPRCVSCPSPQFTEAARAAKAGGSVILRIAVEADGTARILHVVRGFGYGLTVQAIRAVSNWKFEPARSPDGKPTAVAVDVEVVFRLR